VRCGTSGEMATRGVVGSLWVGLGVTSHCRKDFLFNYPMFAYGCAPADDVTFVAKLSK
jgi:hypothetical protein